MLLFRKKIVKETEECDDFAKAMGVAKSTKSNAIAHYSRMIDWVESHCDKFEDPDEDLMVQNISEAWFSSNCSFCQVFSVLCGCCPFNRPSSFDACSYFWGRMYEATMWCTWVYWAKRMRQSIENVDLEDLALRIYKFKLEDK